MTKTQKKTRKKVFLPAQVEGLVRHGRISLEEPTSRPEAQAAGQGEIIMKRKIEDRNGAGLLNLFYEVTFKIVYETCWIVCLYRNID